MTNGTVCPDIELLSRFLDHELGATEESALTRHVETCAKCRFQLEDLKQAEALTRTQLPIRNENFTLLAASPSCPSPEHVTAYMQGLLTKEENLPIEQHLRTCDICLHEAKEASRVLVFLSVPQQGRVSASLKAQVARAWEPLSVAASVPSLPRLVIQLTERGLRLIETYLTPPLLSVQEVQPQYRSSALTLRLNAGDAEMDVLAVPEEDGVTVTLTLSGPERTALADHRVFIRQQGRAIFSAQTDHQGVLRIPPLEPGVYEFSCHEVLTAFQLELRP